MSRLPQVHPESATGKTHDLLQAVQKKLGLVPNMMRAMGNSPAVLEAYLQFSGSLSKGSLSGKLREQIALAVGEHNGCDYCLSAHTAFGKMLGLSPDQIRDSRLAQSVDPAIDAVLKFAVKTVDTKGHVDDADLDELRAYGYSEGDIAEIVANVSLNVFTNIFNHVADTDIDFPAAERLVVA